MLQDFPGKEKPQYLKARDNPRDLLSKKKPKKYGRKITRKI